MENESNLSIFDLSIDEEGKSNLSAIAQWANINAIVGFTGVAVSVLGFIITMLRISSYGGSASVMTSSFFGVFIGLIISLALNLSLLYAAVNIRKAVQLSNQTHLVTGLTRLAGYFKIFGILMIICIVIVVLAFVFIWLMGNSLWRNF